MVFLKNHFPAKPMRKIYRLLTPRKTMDAVEVSSDDSIIWKVVGLKNGCQVCVLAYFSEFAQCLELIQEIGANISRDRHLRTIRK